MIVHAQKGSFVDAGARPLHLAGADLQTDEPGIVDTVQIIAVPNRAGEVAAQLIALVDHFRHKAFRSVRHNFYERTAFAVAGGDEHVIENALALARLEEDGRSRVDVISRLPGEAPAELALAGRDTHEVVASEEH